MGNAPALDMEYEKRVQAAIREIVTAGLAESAHDVGEGGLAVALAECCFGRTEWAPRWRMIRLPPELLLFHEGPSRILVSTAQPDAYCSRSPRKNGVEACASALQSKRE